ARTAVERIVSGAAVDHVIAGDRDDIGAFVLAVKDVVAAAAVDGVVAAFAQDSKAVEREAAIAAHADQVVAFAGMNPRRGGAAGDDRGDGFVSLMGRNESLPDGVVIGEVDDVVSVTAGDVYFRQLSFGEECAVDLLAMIAHFHERPLRGRST